AHELACRSHPVRDAPRTSVVQTADEPPQLIPDVERDAHRRANAHVLQVLDVNRRDASKDREAEVEWRSCVGSQGRNDPRWLLVDVEDETQPVLEIQPACLRGDGGRGIVQPEIRLVHRIPRFGVDGAAAILVESIEHDALESGRSPHLLRDDRGKLAQRARALHAQERRAERVMNRTLLWSLWVRLELEDRGTLVMVNDPVESLRARADG